jgi:hypothetical protein
MALKLLCRRVGMTNEGDAVPEEAITMFAGIFM